MTSLAGLVDLLHILTCRHPSTTVEYDDWRHDPDVGDVRVITVRCIACRGVLNIRSELKGAPWL